MYDCDSTTVQYCIIGEGLYNSRNSKGARAYATQWGGEHSTMHHCLITNCNNRTPRFNGVRDNSNNPGDHDQFVDSEFFNNFSDSGNIGRGKPSATVFDQCLALITSTTALKPCLQYKSGAGKISMDNTCLLPDLDITDLQKFIKLFKRIRIQKLDSSLMIVNI